MIYKRKRKTDGNLNIRLVTISQTHNIYNINIKYNEYAKEIIHIYAYEIF